MKLTRRTLLKGILGVGASFVIPTLTRADIGNNTEISEPVKGLNIAEDFHIDCGGDIRYIGENDNTYTVLELHRHLQDLSDRAWFNAEEISILDSNPSIRKSDNYIELVNEYNIDDNAGTHLRDGTIIQDEGKTMFTSSEVNLTT